MSYEYLLLPHLKVQAANAQSTWWLINAAPVVAANLFAHNLGLKAGKISDDQTIFPRRVGIIHHDAQLLGERFFGRLQPQQRRGAVFIDRADYPKPRGGEKLRPQLSLQPTVTCHLTLSLLLAFDVKDGIPALDKVEEFLSGARLAGGQIISFGQPTLLTTQEDVRREIRKSMRTGPQAFWIVERMDLMENPQGSADPLDALIQACTFIRPREHDESAASDTAKLPDSWIVPTTLGYATLTQFAARKAVRGGYPHDYAEPLVGLAQYVSIHQFADRPLPLWRYDWPRDDVFIVTQKEN